MVDFCGESSSIVAQPAPQLGGLEIQLGGLEIL